MGGIICIYAPWSWWCNLQVMGLEDN